MKKVFYFFVAGILISCGKEIKLDVPASDINNEVNDEVSIGEIAVDQNINTPVDHWNNYQIKKGNNFSDGVNFAPLDHDTIIAEFTFDTSAVYETLIPENQEDWCKLIGFSDCGGLHQQNSARVVWRWNPDIQLIELGEYYYKKGIVSYNSISTMELGDTVSLMMYVTKKNYVIQINEVESISVRPCKNSANRYWLLPYFGGDEQSPKNISIYINHIFPKL